MRRFWPFGTILLVIVMGTASATAAEQMIPIGPRANAPLPEGRRIDARDGDVVVIDDDARVRFVRRRNASARIIFNAVERWVVLLADFAPANSRPDGSVDFTFSWRQVDGNWPIDERWEGTVVIEDYVSPGFGANSMSLVFPTGRIQFLGGGPGMNQPVFDPPPLAVLTYRSAGTSSGGPGTFDQVEPRVVAEASANARNPNTSYSTFTGPGGVSGSVAFGADSSSRSAVVPGAVVGSSAGPTAPIRVGGTIAMPRKTHDVEPVYPESLRNTGVAGVIIIELVVGIDGSVTSAKVLRGQPGLDGAAVDAARQWRYEPTLLNGAAVPIILTATVNVQPRERP